MRCKTLVVGMVATGVLLAGAAGCTVKRSNPITPGAGLAVDGDAVSLDPAAVPIVNGACANGQVVARSGDGWVCAPPGGPVGPTGADGPTGPTGTDCDTTALTTLQAAVTALQTDVATLKAAQCPPGFTYDGTESPTVVCYRHVFGLTDQLVKVGNFWIDRYESTLCPSSGALGTGPGYDTAAWACSAYGQPPQGNVTWFQAAAMCANAGKRLCTNAEWQTAASGTVDPGPHPTTSGPCAGLPSTTGCNTCAGSRGTAGWAANCVSRFGAHDLIGNYAEWVADWFLAGRGWADATFNDGSFTTPWPAGYGDTCGTSPNETSCDGTNNADGRASNGTSYKDGLPAAGIRGGSWVDGASAGSYTLNLDYGPTFAAAGVAGRCCVGQ